jgi:hypothetical protein
MTVPSSAGLIAEPSPVAGKQEGPKVRYFPAATGRRHGRGGGSARRAGGDRVVRGGRRGADGRPDRRPGRCHLIARRSKKIALQAVLVGMGLSLVAKVVAALGLLPPAAAAVVQEVIDVLAIGIALRAVLPGAVHTIAMPAADIATAVRLRAEHDATLPLIEQIRSVADELSSRDCDLEPVRLLLGRLEGELLPHERADEELLVPLVDRALGGNDATAAMSRTHAEIEHQVSRLKAAHARAGHRNLPTRGRDRTPPPALRALRRAPAAQRPGRRRAFSLVPDAAASNTTEAPTAAEDPTLTVIYRESPWRRSKCGQH